MCKVVLGDATKVHNGCRQCTLSGDIHVKRRRHVNLIWDELLLNMLRDTVDDKQLTEKVVSPFFLVLGSS